MKNTIKLFGFIALVAVIGFSALSLTGCYVAPEDVSDLSGTITISPSTATLGTELTATYSGSETVIFQWYKWVNGAASTVGTPSTTNPNKYTPTEAGEYNVTVSWEGYKSKISDHVTVTGTSPIGGGILNNATELTIGTWANGNIPTESDVQWFTFTAAQNTQYIHFEPGTMSIGRMQLYESNATTVKGEESLLMGVASFEQTLTSGSRYYIKVSGFVQTTTNLAGTFGTFKIAFSNNTPPAITFPSNTTVLTANTEANGNIAQLGTEWFKFTATANKQYIFLKTPTSGLFDSVNVKLYDTSGNAVGDWVSVSPSAFGALTVSQGTTYYIRVSPSLLFSGEYTIKFSDKFTAGTVQDIVAGTLSDGDVGGDDEGAVAEQWYKFTATANDKFILYQKGTLGAGSIQLIDADGNAVGNSKTLYDADFIPITVTTSSEYYIRVTAYSSDYSGTFKITLGATFTSDTPTALTEGTWADGTLATSDIQWFKFTATAATQYIHYSTSASVSVFAYLYDATGTIVGYNQYLSNSGTNKFSRDVTSGADYYIKVVQTIGTGAYKIAFNTSETAPN